MEAIKAKKGRSRGGEREAITQEPIDRLRREKAEIEKRAAEVEAEKKKPDYDKGWDDGLRWARETHYEDLKRVVESLLSQRYGNRFNWLQEMTSSSL